MIKTDCYAYRASGVRGPECGALKEMVCKKGPCSFYRTHEEAALVLRRANKRREQQGYVPWNMERLR